jgi:hypothetical protein
MHGDAMSRENDIAVLQSLAQQYIEITEDPRQNKLRQLWRDHNSLKPTRPLVWVRSGGFENEVPEITHRECEDDFYARYERFLRDQLWRYSLGDDTIFEPWLTVSASYRCTGWGIDDTMEMTHDGLSFKTTHYPMESDDVERMRVPWHEIDEPATAERFEKLHDAVGNVIPIDLDRQPAYRNWMADLSSDLGSLRGIEHFMLDMMDEPEKLHRVMAFMRDGVLKAQQEAEDAGDYGLSAHFNLSMPYAGDLPDPKPNVRGVKRSDLWCFTAAQEFTLVSPAMHDEFLLQYQLPIMSNFGLVCYGCCENLTNKIDMLRQIPNLRRIGVTPTADLKRCVEQIGTDYAISYRPNPAQMVCVGFDEDFVRRELTEAMETARGTYMAISLKDISTIQGDPTRISRWVRIARELAEPLG